MPRSSDPVFRTHHALRIKGFASTETVAVVAGCDCAIASEHLRELQARGHVQFREARSLWQLTPEGKIAHTSALADDVAGFRTEPLAVVYEEFLRLNEQFKQLCTDWQLRDGAPNDHTDAAYDASVLERLVVLNSEAQPIVGALGEHFERFAGYVERLARACRRVIDGETKMLTGVMCGSYHDVWMELHEDLILTQGVDRAKEGSF